MVQLYNSKIEEKISLVFKIFDFNSDGQVTADDIKVILSYLPLLGLNRDVNDDIVAQSDVSEKLDEGLYRVNDGRDMSESERSAKTA
jgi:Ca2+-binding EF-hand superfamily protein